ncbi:PREDICTED: zinc finger CCCH domain-containing protein 18-like isoform X1 [Lupinus angustifolius]|uniref:zinc finger CCCH domain-containing protein 18-like isoform X1 n=1 Tax=Lupinus angustifolius TaxID=3871 RepID=UPI00092F0F33|nr:PREDICTED: zinc finger CCCH domain-containing protein 18-like isoform X1 [Lupinus angustifolius]XP_019435671.1 PREDICTED: zinc finger CCCH domain-containing protein 18-like isoform X1 [Lupinus angustifolius]
MSIWDYTRILLDKIQKFEPEYAGKIIGYFLSQDNCEQEMAKLASYHDYYIREVAFKAKMYLQSFAARPVMLPISPPLNPQQGFSHFSVISPRTPTSLPGFQVPSPSWDQLSVSRTNLELMAINSLDSMTRLTRQTELLSLENHIDSLDTETGGIAHDYFGLEASAAGFGVKTSRRLSSLSGFRVKTCHYFNKGFCRHGSSCRYYHGQVVSESFPQMYGNDAMTEDQMFSPRSLAQLEAEIVDLMKSRRGRPLSIALLPTAYQDKYNRMLKFDGYLTESQRHGKSGYSLTKLLVRLKNSIQLIQRPNGQHAVILAEDVSKYMQKGDFGQNISASLQIYLTFPAESTFTDEDVANYFNTFGCVDDVRIPPQQRRMFAFVTFVDPETVKRILETGNPHYVSGSRVLVKPYRDKPKDDERKFPDRIDHPVSYSPRYSESPLSEYAIIECGTYIIIILLVNNLDQHVAFSYQNHVTASNYL